MSLSSNCMCCMSVLQWFLQQTTSHKTTSFADLQRSSCTSKHGLSLQCNLFLLSQQHITACEASWVAANLEHFATSCCSLTLPASHTCICVQIKKVHEEEWSFIPVGGPLPVAQQPITAFGAAANLVHPATGYSIARSLREAPTFAQEVATLLRQQHAVGDTAESVWDALWPQEKRRQVCCICRWFGSVTLLAAVLRQWLHFCACPEGTNCLIGICFCCELHLVKHIQGLFSAMLGVSHCRHGQTCFQKVQVASSGPHRLTWRLLSNWWPTCRCAVKPLTLIAHSSSTSLQSVLQQQVALPRILGCCSPLEAAIWMLQAAFLVVCMELLAHTSQNLSKPSDSCKSRSLCQRFWAAEVAGK